MTDTARWLDVVAASEYVSMPSHKFLRSVAAGKLPQPSKALGRNTPRWDRDAIDAKISGNNAAATTRAAFDGVVAKIEEKGRARREALAARRDREGIPISKIRPEETRDRRHA